MTNAAAASPPDSTSIWEDFADIFIEPVAVFNRRRDGKFGLALLVLAIIATALSVGLHNGLAPIIDAETSRATAAMLAKNPQLSSDQLSMGQNVMEKFAMYGAGLFLFVGVLVAVGLYVTARIGKDRAAIAAAMVWLVGLVPGIITALRS